MEIPYPLHQLHCALVSASATPLVGMVPGALSGVISLVRLAFASLFFLGSNVLLSILMAIKPMNGQVYHTLGVFERRSHYEALCSSILLLRSILSVATGGMYGYFFEKLNGNYSYGQVTGLSQINGSYASYSGPRDLWF